MEAENEINMREKKILQLIKQKDMKLKLQQKQHEINLDYYNKNRLPPPKAPAGMLKSRYLFRSEFY